MNKRDKDLKDYMMLAENQCQTFKDGHIEWIPKIRVWLTRR